MNQERHAMFDKAVIALDLSPAELPLLDCLPPLQQ
jgi:hypothetical protein